MADLVHQKVDVIFTANTPAALAAKKSTSSIPIVIVSLSDPVEAGVVNSLARPGGNITGLTRFSSELSGKRLELLKEAFRKSLLWLSFGIPKSQVHLWLSKRYRPPPRR